MVFGFSARAAFSKVSNFVLGLIAPTFTPQMAIDILLGKRLRDDDEDDEAEVYGRVPQPTTAQRATLTPISRRGAAYSPTPPATTSKSFSTAFAATVSQYQDAIAQGARATPMPPSKKLKMTPPPAATSKTAPHPYGTRNGGPRTGSNRNGSARSGSSSASVGRPPFGRPPFGLPSPLFPNTKFRPVFQPSAASNTANSSHKTQSGRSSPNSGGLIFGVPSIPSPDLSTGSSFTGSASSAKSNRSNSCSSNPTFGSASLPRSNLFSPPVAKPNVTTNDNIHSPPTQRERCKPRRHVLACKHIVRPDKNSFCAPNCASPGHSNKVAYVCLECCVGHAAYRKYFMTEGFRQEMDVAQKAEGTVLYNNAIALYVDALLEAKYACRDVLEKLFADGIHTVPADESKIPRGNLFAADDGTRDIYEKVALMPFEAIVELHHLLPPMLQARKPRDTPTTADISNTDTTTTPSGGRFFTAQNGSSYYTGPSTRNAPSAFQAQGTSPCPPPTAPSHPPPPTRPPPRFRSIIPPPMVLGKRWYEDTPEPSQAPASKHQKRKIAFLHDPADNTARGTKHGRDDGVQENAERPTKRRSMTPPAVFGGSLASRKRERFGNVGDDESGPLRKNACTWFTHDPMSMFVQDKNAVRDGKRKLSEEGRVFGGVFGVVEAPWTSKRLRT
ncbi:hypothetical protein BU16DRAFT_114962 [Lophium mytilinum]|uniref:Uncharacterized protein n=1 Tax=Lophium mytilinum TaxID=390894 RepID=A0A6A6QLA1_9PEZI|nr:hypothetical protein BU16DRAFT_114962 [Lophium mytilinum]